MALSINEKKILLYLFENPLASNHTIATYMNIHHATVSAIRKKLEETVGLSYNININPKKAGLDGVYMVYFSLTPNSRSEKDFSAFIKLVQSLDGVISVGLVTHNVWDGWFRVVSQTGDIDRVFFLMKQQLGGYVDRFEILKHSDGGITGTQDIKKLIDIL